MPRATERQIITDELLDALFISRTQQAAEYLDEVLFASSDDESSSSDEVDDLLESNMPKVLKDAILDLHSARYLNERSRIEKTSDQLVLCLTVHKFTQPHLFRQSLRINPTCFDALLLAISDHPIFTNNSNQDQIPVEWQLAITLYRFGHFGNAASAQKVALWAGVGYGTVDRCTRRVIRAVCDDNFRRTAIRWPSNEEKEEAMQWTEDMSCPFWRNGWIMVDGTLVPLFARPGLFGTTWFDRKSNYSLNVQLISLWNLRIIDYGIGLPGSQHDATAWKRTRLPQEHATLLGPNEWIWADTAYPLQSWLVAPYKKPEKNLAENARFNYHVSRIRIRSEHCVGFLKGRFPSLRGLRLQLSKPRHVQFATFWVIACIAMHNFAMEHEGNEDFTVDEFFREGQEAMDLEAGERLAEAGLAEVAAGEVEQLRAQTRDAELLRAKVKREELKVELFQFIGE